MPSKKLKNIIAGDKAHLFQNYGDRLPACFVRGDGSYLYDQDNREYIDFLSGLAVSSLGYGHKALARALHGQIDRIIHSSNLFYNREQVDAAQLLSELTFPGKTLFVNSGAEANEAAIKLARRYGLREDPRRFHIVSFTNSFHGRTFASMTATGQARIHGGFGPLVPGFTYLPFNDIDAFGRAIRKNGHIAGVILELIQGEGGITVADRGFVKELFALCASHDIVTILDEVQTGVGRTGTLFAYQQFGVIPDILTMAKGLGGGIPIGAIHAKNHLADHFVKGSHGSTFGGNHLATAAAAAVLGEVRKKSFLDRVSQNGAELRAALEDMKAALPCIAAVRGLGLHIGIELTVPAAPLVAAALDRGLVINGVAERVLRIMPPLTIDRTALRAGLSLLEEILRTQRGMT